MAPTQEYRESIRQTLSDGGVPEDLVPTVLAHIGDSRTVARALGRAVGKWAAEHDDPNPVDLHYSLLEAIGWKSGDPEPDQMHIEIGLNNLYGRGDGSMPRSSVIFDAQSQGAPETLS